jgi:hypothetical protein
MPKYMQGRNFIHSKPILKWNSLDSKCDLLDFNKKFVYARHF